MRDYQKAFIELALSRDVLRFVEFTLKSGRVSPYFFNAGLFNTGSALARLGRYYVEAIVDRGLLSGSFPQTEREGRRHGLAALQRGRDQPV